MGEHGDQHYVWCHACRASGPECDTEAEAIEMWDKPARKAAIFDEQNTLLRVKIKLYEDCRKNVFKLVLQAEILEETLYKLRGWLNEKSACSNCAEAARILEHTIKGLENDTTC
jgi:hypothetical protein